MLQSFGAVPIPHNLRRLLHNTDRNHINDGTDCQCFTRIEVMGILTLLSIYVVVILILLHYIYGKTLIRPFKKFKIFRKFFSVGIHIPPPDVTDHSSKW
jgi:hypothetical protein